MRNYNPDVAKKNYEDDKKLRAKADKNGRIWVYGNECVLVVQL